MWLLLNESDDDELCKISDEQLSDIIDNKQQLLYFLQTQLHFKITVLEKCSTIHN